MQPRDPHDVELTEQAEGESNRQRLDEEERGLVSNPRRLVVLDIAI